MGALATVVIMVIGPWGLLIDTVVFGGVVLGLYLRSLAHRVDHANAFSDVAESGRAVDIKATRAAAGSADGSRAAPSTDADASDDSREGN